MCGIAGLIGLREPPDPALLEAMSDALAHRGPDDSGVAGWWRDGTVRLARRSGELQGAMALIGHRRLSILDLSPAGRQPMASADRRHAIAFNGEIYNHRALATALPDWHPSSGSDTETLLACLARDGIAGLPAARGMFAFAWLDGERRRLVLARDAFGIKPLFIAAWRDGLAFASEWPALAVLPGVARRVEAGLLRDMLVEGLAVRGRECLIDGIASLPPGTFCGIGLDAPRLPEPLGQAIPGLVPEAARPPPTLAEAASRLRGLLDASVRMHLLSDAPLGCALSGGVDSSAIVHLVRHADPGRELHAIGFAAGPDSEERLTGISAASARCHLHLVRPSAEQVGEAIAQIADRLGEPLISGSYIGDHLVYGEAKRLGLKVMLDGQGADELFGGYDWLLGARMASLCAAGRPLEAIRFARAALGGRGLTWRNLLSGGVRAWRRRGPDSGLRPAPWLRLPPPAGGPAAMGTEGAAPLGRQLAWCLARDGLPTYLHLGDRMAMLHGVENRVPFLTTDLLAFARGLPEEFLIDGEGTTKKVLREAVRGLVPGEVLDRRIKLGYPTPEADWLRAASPWVDRVVADALTAPPPWLHARHFADEMACFRAGRRYGPALWRTLAVLHWGQCRKIAWP